ncbi:hypothetical protein [Brevibacillus nitrificans]|uniref:hypothetical protein n=1 Tax=Brevibacillus nitrificans TaxID=651560 RepID=UPI002855292A|nr:hypothetical protein [Brevibacillus nitrificans]MDR7313843.1 hypothetical protein [Brevibacillus nitrificans]
MIIQVNFGPHDYELICCSAKAGRDIHRLRKEFLAWLYDVQIDHPFWEYQDGEKFAVNYRSNALVYWLNRHRFRSGAAKAKMIGTSAKPKKHIHF